jgi:hypothetical protein
MVRRSVAARLSTAAVVVVAALGIGAAACGTPGEGGRTREGDDVTTTNGPPAAEKHGTGELRTDVEPLTKRFSALEDPGEVRWMSGTYGDPDAPGASTYWIDAVITLDADRVRALTTAYSPQSTSETPAVVDGMRDQLPPGPFQTSAALDAAFNEEDWWATAYLDPQARRLVLVATGT